MPAGPDAASHGQDAAGDADERAALRALLAGFSLEVSSRRAADAEACHRLLPAGSRVYVPVVPGDRQDRAVAAAAALRRAGLTPVPHIAARRFASAAALDDHLGRLAGAAGVDEVLVVGGDASHPAGSLAAAADVIASGALGRNGIRRVGVAGYPEGHPHIADHVLADALHRKITLATGQGLECYVVTQFCFADAPILRWLQGLAAGGGVVPVRVGIAGPARVGTLVRYALRCGIGASARALAAQGSRFARLAVERTPDVLLHRLARAAARGAAPGLAGVHFFTFGGAAETARWVAAAAAGRVVFAAGGEGFSLG